MHRRPCLVALAPIAAAAACGSSAHPASDAGPTGAVPDAASCPTTLLTGDRDVGPQGWSVVMQPPATLSYGANVVTLHTATSSNVGGQLLLDHPGALEAGAPFKIQVVMRIEAVSPHNQLDSAAAILGSFTPRFGTAAERSQMIYLDGDKLGWGDGTQSFTVQLTDGAYHTYELAVDAAGAATVSVDGTPALTRSGFTTNGALAVGDQTNDPDIDSTLHIRSVTRLCP